MVRRQRELVSVNVRDFIASNATRKALLVPDEPGIYYWTLDLSSSLLGRHFDRINDLLAGPRLYAEGDIGLFYRVRLSHVASPLTAVKEEQSERLLEDSELRAWLAWVVDCFQRPLYVGKAKRLRRRLMNHLADDSRLRTYLESLELTPEDCNVVYVSIPGAAASEASNPPAPDQDSAEDPSSDSHTGDEAADEVTDDDDVWDEEESWVPAEPLNPALLAVSIAESVAIKGMKPYTGKKGG